MRTAAVLSLLALGLVVALWLGVGCNSYAPTLPSPDNVGDTVDIYGQVTRDNSPTPLPGARVDTTDGVRTWTDVTDENGNYRLVDVTPGARGVSFAHELFATEYRTAVVEDEDVELNVDMSAPPGGQTECPVIDLNPVGVDDLRGLATVSGTIENVDADQAVLIHNGQGMIIGLEPMVDAEAALPGGGSTATFETIVALQEGENDILLMVANAACTQLSQTLSVPWTPSTGMEFVFRATLTWDTGPNTDLDLHVWNPDGTHCGFVMMDVGGSQLDVDATRGYGPENITCRGAAPGRFRLAVNAWYLRDSESSANTPTQATVRVTNGSLPPNEVDVTLGPHLFTQDASDAGASLNWASYDVMFPMTCADPEWWRVCDVVVAPDGAISVVAPDCQALDQVWTQDDWDAYWTTQVAAARSGATKPSR